MAAVIDRSTREQDYSARITTVDRASRPLADSINTLLEQMQSRDLQLRRRTTELEQVNRELEAFSFSVSHDLRAPISSIDGFSQALADYYEDKLDAEGREYIRWIRDAAKQMQALVESLLQMSRLNQHDLVKTDVDLSAVAHKIANALRQSDSSRNVMFHITDGLRTSGDERLLHAVLENMMSNAWKFTSKRPEGHIEVGAFDTDETRIYYVRDNGAGFDATQGARLFSAFQRLHSRSDFDGTGIGLATVKRVIERHGGTVWAEGEVGRGATFYFTTGERLRQTEAGTERMTA
jgi:light-regulated signal transduction histidine kinase (bacteriophytochrome)